MDILQQIQKSQLESLDIFRLKYSLELKSFFGKYYKLFKEAYERAISNKSADYYAYSILHNMVDIIQKKIDIYDFSPDSLGKINDRILAAIIDDDKKQAARLIQAFRQPGIKASLRCFAMAKNPEGHAFVLESLKTAGNQLGVFETVFGDFVNASEEFKRFIIPKVVEHQFYRYKSVVENIAYGYNLSYPIDNAKAFITSLRDILAGDFKKYLDAQDAKTAYMLLNLLRETDKPYQKLFEEMLNDPDKTRRFLAFFYMSRNRADKLELADKYFEQDDLRLYAPLLDCIDGYSKYSMNTARYKAKYGQKPDAKTAKLYRSLYPKLLALWACLPKKNNIFSSTATVWFSHEVKEEEIISKILHILKSLDDKTLIHDFEDNRYDKLSPSDKLLFVTALKDRIKRDYRKEMLNYFTVTEYFNDGYKKYFIDNPLTYAEAVTVSDYLKTKKTDVKKNIVEHFDRMSDGDKARLKAYLEAAPEEYKRECARDIKTDGAKADSKPVAELPKFAFTDLPKDKIREILTAIRAVIVGHKDCEITLNDGEKALFGSQLWLPKADDGKPYFANEVNAAIAAFDLSGGGLVSLLYALYEAAEKDDSPRGKGNAVAALLGEAASQNVFGSDNAVVVNSFLMPYIENYIKDKQTAPLQAEIIKRLTDVYGSIEDFPKKEFNHTVYYGYYSIIKSKDSDKLRTAQHIAALINYNVSDDENLAAMKAIAEYVMAKNACKNNPLSQCILISKWYNAGLASREEIGEYLKRGLFELSGFFETPPYIKNGYGDKALDANIYNGKFSAEFKEIIENVQTEMLETEILRAQAETPYTAALLRCKKYIGVKFYAAVLRAFQKMTLPRDAYGATKDGAFARILERTESRADDSYEAFCALVNEYKLSDKDLIKGVLYNNNQTILDLTAKLLNKPGFISCVMFFKAHLRDSEVSAGVRDKIALFSPIDIADFKEGAVDTDWFFAMKSETPKAVFD
ncbi:MAG: DUF5724 domain-containing protein, partial [Clostridiales bacterium]|nr:DUF5724 domain-containing protein [Clostridiales bacterium]